MSRGRLVVAILAALAVGLVAALAGGGKEEPGGAGKGKVAKAPAGAIRVTFGYSPEKAILLDPLIAKFNAKKTGVFVEGEAISSGVAEEKIAKGTYKPVAWSPASSLWGRLLNYEADRPFAPKESPSIVRTPLVIAMWEPLAKALGYPRKKIGFEQVLELAQAPGGWERVGHPEFGAFKLVHTNPDFSTSGLSAVVAEYYAATGKREGLTEADVTSAKVRRTVRGIERSIVHYGDTTLFISDQMRAEGPAYASAVAMEETTLLDFNRKRGSQQKLVAIYPSEGTFYSDSPFIVLDAGWVTAEQAEGARAFQAFLAEEITPDLAARSGFRPADFKARPGAAISKQFGADPAQPERVLGLPEPKVLQKVKLAWRRDRKPANIELILDVSGSMGEEDRLERAKRGLEVFFRQVSPQDRVGLTVFNEQPKRLAPLTSISTGLGRLRGLVKGLQPDGGTAFLDAIRDGFEELRGKDLKDSINAVVLLTDGEDTDSTTDFGDALATLAAQGDSPNHVRVFTIAYSSGATGAREQLDQLAGATGGQGYEGSTEDIESVYRSISSFF